MSLGTWIRGSAAASRVLPGLNMSNVKNRGGDNSET